MTQLSATMLGDQAEKTKNPLKSAMRRRKAKTVSFANPTYIDPSDVEYSTEEEDLDGDSFGPQQQQGQHAPQQTKQQQAQRAQQASANKLHPAQEVVDETAKVEPLKPRSQLKEGVAEAKKSDPADDTARTGSRTSEETVE